ncbi:MAG: hypothetical protein A2583_13115 [Bdellovibrionales bacterium RIFOXYD1_FULL_53_11]|nr:MAG: hypothetical protein A2583_13115 [Bdellovibrionales bacterium RIFOXYD1_FULL_53_11]
MKTGGQGFSWAAAVVMALSVSVTAGYRAGKAGPSVGMPGRASVAGIAAANPGAGGSGGNISHIEEAVDAIRIGDAERRLAAALDGDGIERMILRVVIAANHAEAVPETDKMSDRYLEEFSLRPLETLQAVKKALGAMPADEFPIERAALIALASGLPGHESEAAALALTELMSSVPAPRLSPARATTQEELDASLSSTPEMTLPVTAHSVFLKTTADPERALEGTVDGIVAQRDLGVRNIMASQFVALHPSMADELRTRLSQRGVLVSDAGGHGEAG